MRAQAADPPTPHRVLIILDEPGDALIERVRAEVSAVAGFTVVARPASGSLDADARAEHAEVAIRKVPSGRGVEVWMADATTGRSLLRQLVVDESPEGPDQSLVALQTAELLRTSLLHKLDQPLPASAGLLSPPLPAVVTSAPVKHAGEGVLQVGGGVLYSRGGVSPALEAWLSYQHCWSRHLGIAVEVDVPLARGSTSDVQGSADVGVVFAGAGLLAQLRSDRGNMRIGASMGGGAAAVLVTGRATPGFVGSSTRAYTGLGYLRLHAGWEPTGWLGLGATALFGTTTSRIRIEFADHEVAEWGLPFVAGGAYAEVRWE
jgi:hypothetical protein